MLYSNVRSICNKFDELCIILDNSNVVFDVLCLSETWLHKDLPDSAFSIKNYALFRDDRKLRKGGGVCIWAKYDMNPVRFCIDVNTPIEIECIAVILEKNQLGIINIYVPPNLLANIYIDVNIFVTTIYDNILLKWPHFRITIVGDFNNMCLLHIQRHCALTPMIDFNTRGDSILDQVMVDDVYISYLKAKNLPPLGESDHTMVQLSDNRRKTCHDIYSKSIKERYSVYDFRQSNIDAFVSVINMCNFQNLYDCPSVNDKVSFLNEALDCAMNVITKKEVIMSKNDKPWMTPKLKLLINNKWNAYRKKDFEDFKRRKQILKAEILHAKNAWKNKNCNSVKNFWEVCNLFTGRKSNSDCLKSLTSSHNSINDLVNEINNEFCKSFIDSGVSEEIMKINVCIPFMREISEFEVMKALSTLKRTANPTDDYPIRLLIEISTIISKPLANIYNCCIQNMCFPDIWKIAEVRPIPKVHQPKIDDLRPISLLSVFSKIFEKLIIEELKPLLVENYGINQFAYRPNSSTTCALLEVQEFITKHLDDSDCLAVVMCAVDFSKAFDKMDHALLLNKLNKMNNIPKGFIKWLKSYLSNRSQFVSLHNSNSEVRNVTSGIGQGSIIGPYLFAIFISDYFCLSSNTLVVKYADDTTLLLPITKNNKNIDIEQIKLEINCLQNWSDKNRMCINASKSKLLYFTKRSPCEILPTEFLSIKSVYLLKLLGVTFTSEMTFKEHFYEVIKKSSQRLYYLRVMKPYLTKAELWNIYYSLIRSILEYVAPMFVTLNKSISDDLEILQRRVHRIICGSSSKCPDCNVVNLLDRRAHLSTRMYSKIIKDKKHVLYKHIPKTGFRNRSIIPHFRTTKRSNSFFMYHCIRTSGVSIG
jgi:hypothetical protein